MPTTFVLGAGASRDAGYPFANDMGRGLLRWMEQADPEGCFDFSGTATYLRETFENAEDIEALLTQMDEAAGLRTSPCLDERIRAAVLPDVYRPVLSHGLRRWFEQIGRTPSNQADSSLVRSSYHLFASEVIQPGDSVVTFNYDLSLDKELKQAGLWEVGDGYGFEVEGLPASSKVKLLKLHGSINWRALLFGGRRGGMIVGSVERSLGRRPVFCDSDLRMLGYVHEVDSRVPRGSAAMVDSLILPVREKQFFFHTSFGDEWISFWDLLWSAAAESLRTSDRIVVCGYSVPPIDVRACKMLLEDPQVMAPFEVCCGGDSDAIVERLRSFGRDAHAADRSLFGEWVTTKSSQRIS